jgi:hypothetical protein
VTKEGEWPTQRTTGLCRKQESRTLCWKASTDITNVLTSQGNVLVRANIPIEDQSDASSSVADFSIEITLK